MTFLNPKRDMKSLHVEDWEIFAALALQMFVSHPIPQITSNKYEAKTAFI